MDNLEAKRIEMEGVDFVRSVVRDNYSNFQIVDHNNDQGNDCYIEFVVDGKATNWCVFVQIKSGKSFKSSKGYKIPASKQHLTYWHDPVTPIIGIVYDPVLKQAFWVDIAEYIRENKHVLNQKHHTIRVSSSKEFSRETFLFFRTHFMSKIREFKSFENFGRSLNLFACLNDGDVCYEGLKSLYSNHRDKSSTWLYILSSFGKIKEEGIRRNILGLIGNYIDNPFVFWHQANMQYYPKPEMQTQIPKLLSDCFSVNDIDLLLPYVRNGVFKGEFSYIVYRILDVIQNAPAVLKELSFQPQWDEDDRNNIFWIYLNIAKFHSREETLATAEQYFAKFPFAEDDEVLLGTKESIEAGELWSLG